MKVYNPSNTFLPTSFFLISQAMFLNNKSIKVNVLSRDFSQFLFLQSCSKINVLTTINDGAFTKRICGKTAISFGFTKD